MRSGFSLQDDDQEYPGSDPAPVTNETMRPGRNFSSEDLDVAKEQEVEPDVNQEVLMETDNGFPEDKPVHFSFWSSPVLWILIVVILLSGLEVINLASEIFQRNTYLGMAFSSLLIVLLMIVMIKTLQEIRGISHLSRSDKVREKISHITEQGSFKDAREICLSLLKKNVPGQLVKNFEKSLDMHFSPAEVFAVYERMVLNTADERAKKVIFQRSMEISVLVAVSPLAWLDMALASFRSLRMIREIAEIYGFRPGIWGRMAIYRKVVTGVIFIGLGDILMDATSDFAANSATSILDRASGQINKALAVGLAAGYYATKIGFIAVRSVRPVDLTGNSREIFNLSRLRLDLCKYVIRRITFRREQQS